MTETPPAVEARVDTPSTKGAIQPAVAGIAATLGVVLILGPFFTQGRTPAPPL
ncbi:hypothetical protein [Halodurantibacterium flavum]|uniref:Uncharacterized protein n=1 Tax=Halodurantibacterium flavum TaxID=1382802 RepID=A0ABW4S0Z9_9RHOB